MAMTHDTPSKPTMTTDEQEALSFRYVIPRVMRLSSGRFALLIDGQEPIFCEANELSGLVPSTDEIEAYHESLRASRPKVSPSAKLTTLDLAELGL